jgi:hypothetical protein
MIRRITPFSAAALLSVTLLVGCDNVHWGGTQVTVVPPPPQVRDEASEDAAPGVERMPEGPILYYVQTQGGTATLFPVGEISGDSLRPLAANDWNAYGNRLIAEHMRPNSEFTLFHRGARAGTLVVQSAGLADPNVCPRLPRATGIIELTTLAAGVPEFLAMARTDAPNVGYQPDPRTVPDARARLQATYAAERILRARGAPLPGNWERALAQLQPFPVAGLDAPGMAATFLVSDTLGPGLDDEGQSTFFIGIPDAQLGYDTAYVQFTDYARERKAAPRTVDFLDWNRDGQPELLLLVYGTQNSWFEAIGRSGGRWRRILQDRCVQPGPPPGTTP